MNGIIERNGLQIVRICFDSLIGKTIYHVCRPLENGKRGVLTSIFANTEEEAIKEFDRRFPLIITDDHDQRSLQTEKLPVRYLVHYYDNIAMVSHYDDKIPAMKAYLSAVWKGFRPVLDASILWEGTIWKWSPPPTREELSEDLPF